MKLLIGASPSKIFHLKEFGEELTKFGVQYKLVGDSDVYDGFPSRRISHWFQSTKKFEKLIDEFKPDVVFIDRLRHFGLATVKAKLPLITHLRGDFWSEAIWARNTIYKPLHKRVALWQWERIAHQCFSRASMILPICQYLEKVVKEHYPHQETHVLYQGIDPSSWYPVEPMKLKHPCVGLLQDANIWGKTEEMFILTKVLKEMPEVMFYWVGDGPYRKDVLRVLEKFDNFKWLGKLDYPDKVREYLMGIDVYALVSGMDMAPLTLLEAQLMEKPVVATKVGGIPELMEDQKTGFLVEKGDHKAWVEKLSNLINDHMKSKQLGTAGRNYVKEKFRWEIIVKRFSEKLNDSLKGD